MTKEFKDKKAFHSGHGHGNGERRTFPRRDDSGRGERSSDNFHKDKRERPDNFNRDNRERTGSPERERRERPDNFNRDDKPYAPKRSFSGGKPGERRSSYNPNFNKDRKQDGKPPRPYGNKGGSFKPGGHKPHNNDEEFRSAPREDGSVTYRPKTYLGRKRKPDGQPKRKVYPSFKPEAMTEAMRLNRYISISGICSRREADTYIQAGLVTVNGQVVTELGVKVNPTDEVRFNGEVIQGERKIYILMNKPKGFVTTVEDPNVDKKVMDIIKGACRERVYPVGRLDKNTVGVLLITNDGDLTKKLTHPSYEKKKIYQVTLDKNLTLEDMEQIAGGIELEDGAIHADQISYVGDNKKEIGIEIHSGRNRIVRRIFEALGYKVNKLDRVYFAGLTKKKLKRGGWRFLTPQEVAMLKSGLYE